jgi:uncharacterized protein YkwD
MSDNYAIKRYHRQTAAVPGMGKKKKYLTAIVILLVAGILGVAYLVYSSGILAENNPRIAPQLAERINLERQAHNLAPVNADSSLSYQAYTKSQEVRISQLNYGQGANSNLEANTNVIVIPKLTWALSTSDFNQQVGGSLEKTDSAFRENVLNPTYRTIGIGVSSDSYNYYIVTKWK